MIIIFALEPLSPAASVSNSGVALFNHFLASSVEAEDSPVLVSEVAMGALSSWVISSVSSSVS